MADPAWNDGDFFVDFDDEGDPVKLACEGEVMSDD